jgi:hypothetical protein
MTSRPYSLCQGRANFLSLKKTSNAISYLMRLFQTLLSNQTRLRKQVRGSHSNPGLDVLQGQHLALIGRLKNKF